MSNLLFYEAFYRGQLHISGAGAEKGWPSMLYPWFLAKIQMPNADYEAQKAFVLHMGDCIRCGTLAAELQPIAWPQLVGLRPQIEPHIAPADFAAWLQREGIEPSPLIREWLAHYGAAPTKTAPAPQPAPQPAPAPKRESWWDAEKGYLAEIVRTHQFTGARELTRYLHRIADGNSRFRSGKTGDELYVASVGVTLKDTTFKNWMGKIKALALGNGRD